MIYELKTELHDSLESHLKPDIDDHLEPQLWMTIYTGLDNPPIGDLWNALSLTNYTPNDGAPQLRNPKPFNPKGHDEGIISTKTDATLEETVSPMKGIRSHTYSWEGF